MPTLSPNIAAPEDEEDEGFSSGLTRDLQNTVTSTPAAPAATPAPPPVQPPIATTSPVTAPSYTPPDRGELQNWERSKVQDSQALDRSNPAVKPKWWERLVGGLGAGMMAAGGQPGAVAAGESVTNRRYNQAEAQRQGRLTADQAGIDAENANLRGSDQDFERQNQSFNSQTLADQRNATAADRNAQEQQRLSAVAPSTLQPVDPANPMGPWKGMTVGGKPVNLDQPPDSWLKTPAGVNASRGALAKELNLKPGSDDYKFLMANGKLKEPGATTNIRVPSAESERYNDWKAAFKRDNKRDPTAAEVQQYSKGEAKPPRGTSGQFSDLDKQSASEYEKAEAAYKIASEGAPDDAGRAAALADLNAEKARIGATHSQRLRDLGGIPAEDTGAPPAPAAPSAPAAAPAGAAVAPLPPKAVASLKEGIETTFKNNQVWTLQGGKPIRVR